VTSSRAPRPDTAESRCGLEFCSSPTNTDGKHIMTREGEAMTGTQARRQQTILEWIISGGLLGGFAGAVLMFNIWSLGLGLFILGALTAVAGLFIIAAKKA